MKPTSLFLLLFLLFTLNAGAQTLTGKVSDKLSKEPLPGASIYLPDLKTSAITGDDGTYQLSRLPRTKVLFQVSYFGYRTIVVTLDLAQTTTFDFEMELSVREIDPVIITGTPGAGDMNRTPTPYTIIPKIQLVQNASSNIIDALTANPGISQVSTGTGISKPVIRGLGYNRVIVINDGVRQEGQQWGDEHGVEIDEFSVDRVEILKGPASLAYGSDALAGVINMISAPTNPPGTINGSLLSNYQTNNGMLGYSGNIAGNINGFVWDARGSGKLAHSYRNKYDGYVFGSGYRENSFSGMAGVNKSFGYIHLHGGMYHLVPGIVEGERDSSTGKFIRPYAVNDSTLSDTIVSNSEMRTYGPLIPHQDIRHYKAVLNSTFVLGDAYLKAVLGFQQNHRQEFGNALEPETYELYFLLNTLTYDLRYLFPEKKGWSLSAGLNGMQQSSLNKGEEFLVPEYGLVDIGGFCMVKRSLKKLDLAGGIRYDQRQVKSEELLLDTLGRPTTENDPFHEHKFKDFTSSFSSVSGSLGLAWAITENVFTKLNVSRGFRAPNISELGSNGEHEGSGRYELGDANLKPEYSLQFDYALGLNNEHVSAEADLFYTSISNYIYSGKLSSVTGGDSIMDPNEPVPVFKYQQGNALLYGGEALIDVHPHPLDWLHIGSSFAYVMAMRENATDSTKYLPFTPAPKYTGELKAEFKKAGSMMKNIFVRLRLEHYFEQSHIYSAFGTETVTPAYTLMNFGFGTEIVYKEMELCSFYINVNNLFDTGYQDHLSRLKYAPVNYKTGRSGVFNMGRNVSFKLVIPFTVKK